MWSEQLVPVRSLAAEFFAFFNAVKMALHGSSPDGETVEDVRKNVYVDKKLKDIRTEVVTYFI